MTTSADTNTKSEAIAWLHDLRSADADVVGGKGANLGELIAAGPSLAMVLVFRAITFMIPPIFDFFTLRWLRAQGNAWRRIVDGG